MPFLELLVDVVFGMPGAALIERSSCAGAAFRRAGVGLHQARTARSGRWNSQLNPSQR
ncbi:hypothetical protein [Kibdelosporangium philippinense]|uniref:hypothetical protein n=1 Tax=Kibdelosporangium philippinense TaxID=211113 RepID=UPI00361B7446